MLSFMHYLSSCEHKVRVRKMIGKTMKTVVYDASSEVSAAPQYRDEAFVNEVTGSVQSTQVSAETVSRPRPRILIRREARWARRATR